MQQVDSAEAVASALAGKRYVDAEFMYQPRPAGGREQIVFDFTLNSRLVQLKSRDAALFICDSQRTIDSLAVFESQYPNLRMLTAVANPALWSGTTPATPLLLGWDNPERWRRYTMTDRWARIDFALAVGSLLSSSGYLLMPAHDAVWGRGLLEILAGFSERHARNGLPAAVSPYTPYQHSPVLGADIPQDIIDLMNAAFRRDTLFPWKIRLDRVQAFWGKMSMMPFAMCQPVRGAAEKIVWEDDLEIDTSIRRLEYGVRCLWVSNPDLYRQALPAFDQAGLRKVIERTLHYSLNIPGQPLGASTLNFPLGTLGQIRRLLDPHFAHYNALAEALVGECNQIIQARLAQFGASWVDWGLYRYVMRIGDPAVEVWKPEIILV
jgi:hypothetical protein